jgi:hypothetical protein
MEQNGARRFGPCFDAQSQQIEHEHETSTIFNFGIWVETSRDNVQTPEPGYDCSVLRGGFPCPRPIFAASEIPSNIASWQVEYTGR